MFLEFFNHDLNRLSWTEYEVRDEVNHIGHIHLCKRKQVNVETNLCFSDCFSVRNSIVQSLRPFHF